MEGAWLAIGFILASLLAGTAVPSLPVPFAYLPLMLMCGILVMNRVNVVHGALWLVLSGVVLGATGIAPGRLLAYIATAIAAFVLAERVFAKRSVYALIGLGASAGLVFVCVELLHRLVSNLLNSKRVVGMSAGEALWTLMLLLIGLYVGFVVTVMVRRWIGRRFLVR